MRLQAISRFAAGVLAGVFIILWSAPSVAQQICKTPLPAGFELAPLPSDVPPEIARFHGVWGDGKWEGKLCHTLVVEVLNADGDVNAIYSWGAYSGWNLSPGFTKQDGEIDGDELDLGRLRNSAEVSYTLTGERLSGSYWLNQYENKITLSRIAAETAESAAPQPVNPDDAARLVGTWEGEYRLARGGDGDATVVIDSVRDGVADMSMEWRWPVQNRDRRTYSARIVTDAEGRVTGIEPWPGSVLQLEGDRLVGDMQLSVGQARHELRKQ